MSTTMQGIDARGYLIGWANALTNMYSADIKAIPDDKWNATFGGCTRSACEVTADALSLLVWTTATLKGATADHGGAMEALKGTCGTKEAAVSNVENLVAEFCAALGSASDDLLNSNVTPPWQMETPVFMLAEIAVSHLWYHDGQLNYIQSLLGDEKVHWMGD